MTIQQIQDRITNKGDLREVINLLADYIQNNPGGGSSYLVYTANLTQSGTNAPVATELQNTLGAGNWTRFEAGGYENITTTDHPGSDKIFIDGLSNNNDGSFPFYKQVIKNGTTEFIYNLCTYESNGKIVLQLTVRTPPSTGTDLSDLLNAGDYFSLPEIRVYQ